MVRQAHHPELGRRVISKFQIPMIQTEIAVRQTQEPDQG